MKWNTRIVAAVSGTVLAACLAGCGAGGPPLEVVPKVELARYAGVWYEIARYPVSFEEGCVGVTAEYTLRDDGRVNVLNTCIEEEFGGPVRTINGTARVEDPETNAKLAVSFLPIPIFEAPYWIIELDEESYAWAVVGAPQRNFLWILSRTPTIPDDLYADLLERVEAKGFDPERLILTPQEAE